MAEILDPPEQLPEDVRPSVPLDQLAHRAEWAETFRPTDNNFASRFRKPRYGRDIREYGEALQAQKAAAIETQARTNQAAQNFYIRDKQLTQKRILDQSLIDSRHAAIQRDDELLPLRQRQIEQSTKAASALERRRVSDQLKQNLIDEHLHLFHDQMNQDAMAGDGTPESEDLSVIAASRQFPRAYLDPEVKAQVNEANKRIAVRQQQENARANAAAAPPLQLTPAAIARERNIKLGHLNRLKEEQIKAPSKERITFQPEIDATTMDVAALDARLAAPAPATTPPAIAPAQPKQVRQNGVLYTLQPDGSYK